MRRIIFHAPQTADTTRLGAAIASTVKPGTTIGLIGTLGAGKTFLVQAIAEASGINREDVSSPTFVMCQEYHGTRDIFHMDAYRIRDDDEFLELGAEEYFDSTGITLVEWSDRVSDCMPADRLDIRVTIGNDDSRQFEIEAVGNGYEQTVSDLAEKLGVAAASM